MSRSILFLAVTAICLSASTTAATAQADECNRVHAEFNTRQHAFALSIMKFTQGNLFVEGQKGHDLRCQHGKQNVTDKTALVALQRKVDRVCGSRIKWTNCNTACSEVELRRIQQTAKEWCAPFVDTAALIKTSSRACSLIESIAGRPNARADDPELAQAYKDCNASPDANWCQRTWLQLEQYKFPTSGLTCRPTAQTRAEWEQLRAKFDKPGVETGGEACETLMVNMFGRLIHHHDNPRLTRECSKAPAACKEAIEMLDTQKISVPGLTCLAE